MKKWIVSLFAVTFLLTGCKSDHGSQMKENPAAMKEITVTYKTKGEVPSTKNVHLVIEVKQGEKLIDDASMVNFEFWKSGYRKQGEMIEGKHTKDGTYEATAPVKEDGVYYVYAHTEAKGQHVMPKLKIVVGKPDLTKVKKDK